MLHPVEGSPWFDDGNIVVSAGKLEADGSPQPGSVRTCFKVHRSLLSQNSEIFRDMFAMQPPSVVVEDFQGTPLVNLPDDVEDVRSYLTFIYDPTFQPVEQFSRDYVIKMRGALKLAAKYGGNSGGIKDHIAKRLRMAWPPKLEGWHQRWQVLESGTNQKEYIEEMDAIGDEYHWEDLIWQNNEDFGAYEVVALLRESHLEEELHDVLAVAYYDISCKPDKICGVRPGCLIERDYWRLLNGRHQFMTELSDQLRFEDRFGEKRPKSQPRGCEAAICTEARTSFWSLFWELYPTRTDHVAYLAIMQDKATGSTWRFEARTSNICVPCALEIKEVLHKARQHVFDRLPVIFQVIPSPAAAA